MYPKFFGTVNVFIDYNKPIFGDHNFDNKKFKSKERNWIVQSMAEYIYSISKGLPPTKPSFIAEVSYLDNPEARLDISLAEGYISKDGFEDLILNRITIKEKRSSTYLNSQEISECCVNCHRWN